MKTRHVLIAVALGASWTAVCGAAPAQALPPPEPISIRKVWPSKISFGYRVVVQLSSPAARIRLRGDGSKPVVLYLDGRPLPGITVVDGEYDDNLVFELVHNSEDHIAWAGILGLDRSREVALGLQGPEAGTKPTTIHMDFLARPLAITGAFVFGSLVLFALFWAGAKTTMLRDAGSAVPEKAGVRRGWRELGTFSLGRIQMAFWFLLVVIGYMVIWAVTGDTPPLTTSVLTLIGIGSGTALGAAFIDESKRVQPGTQSQLTPIANANFLNDIMTDANGWSFHRLQLVAWTLILGSMFCVSIIKHLVMPDFDGTLLGLIGISSGTYLGFKIPERQS